MRIGRIIFACTLLLAATIKPALAQDSENGAILTWIEESISTPDRMIRIIGVEGALSSSARIAEITISDRDGVWLQLLDAQIDWRRRALFSGRLEIDDLRAGTINVFRKPLPIDTGPAPEARGFSLPELPVDIAIANISTGEINLGDGVIGITAQLTLQAAFSLNSDGLDAALNATRRDGPGGEISLALRYTRETTKFLIDTTVNEPENGVIAHALNLEGRPALAARLAGEGVLDALSVTLGVDVGGARLIDGHVQLADHTEGRSLMLDLRGEIAALVPDAYRPFFAGQSTITARGVLREGGGMRLDELEVATADMQIDGSLETADDGFPRRAALNIAIARANNAPVTLPFGDGLSVQSATLALDYGLAQSGSYGLELTAQNLVVPGFDIATVSGGATGLALNLDQPDSRQISGSFTGALQGVVPASAATAQALGAEIDISAAWDWAAGQVLSLHASHVQAQGLRLAAEGAFSGFHFDGEISAHIDDLRAFSALAGREIAGQIAFAADGRFALLGGQANVEFAAEGMDLQLSQPQFDAVFAGASTITGHLRRDETGLALENLLLTSPNGTLGLNGQLSSAALSIIGQAELADLAPLIAELSGPAMLQFRASGPHDAIDLGASLTTGLGATADLAGRFGTVLDLRARFASLPLDAISSFAPDLGIAGTGSGDLRLTGTLMAPELAFTADVAGFGAAMAQGYGLPLLDIRASGMANRQRMTLTAGDITGAGPLNLRVAGDLTLDLGVMDIRASGEVPLSLGRAVLQNAGIGLTGQAEFALEMTGPFANPSFDGRVSIAGASLFAPAYRVRLDNLDLNANLSGDTLSIASATADFQGGGQVALRGSLGLGAGFPAALEAELMNLTYSDGKIFTTTLNASLGLTGPMVRAPRLEGQVTLLNTEIRIPSGSAAAAIPDITHINVPRPVRRTQQRAGLEAADGQAGAPFSIGLDVAVSSNGRIFLRGRGLDAELGGALRLAGRSDNPTTTGQFDLVRGRMDLLGQRLTFVQGSARLQGGLIPFLDLRAETRSDGFVIGLQLLGLATAPEIILTSSPELPQDEILAQLIFSRGIDALSPFQIAQLASSLAELSGRSNGGLIARLRAASGLDNLDIQSTDGTTSVTAGGYLQENLYSEIEINDAGDASLSINIDIIDGLRGRAMQGSGGDTSIGIYFERDY